MPRSRKSPTKAMINSKTRLANLKSISPNLDLGNGLKAETYEAEIDEVYAILEAYNTKLAEADQILNQFNTKEKALRGTSERMLSGVGVKFGYDSDEYEQAGGIRKSERAKPKPKTPNP